MIRVGRAGIDNKPSGWHHFGCTSCFYKVMNYTWWGDVGMWGNK